MQKETQAIESVKSALEVLNKHLTKQTYLVGDTITLADLIGYGQVWNGYKKVCRLPSPLLLQDLSLGLGHTIDRFLNLQNGILMRASSCYCILSQEVLLRK